jgi:Protein involved in biosynthesis of mitomycin antibiotics/polyketide fumonisin
VLGAESIVEIDESRAVDLALRPGDVEVHHPSILHASDGNTSPKRRCGLTIRYIPTSTRIVTDDEPFVSALLLRGDPSVNRYQPFPPVCAGAGLFVPRVRGGTVGARNREPGVAFGMWRGCGLRRPSCS